MGTSVCWSPIVAEMLVDLVEALEHGAEIVRSDREHGRESDAESME
jgi:hypothetical protein